jgi:hypothetical protein
MGAENIAILGLAISTLVTIIGWLYTASVQRTILAETAKHKDLERELGVFRIRLETIRGITSLLIEQSSLYHKIIAMVITSTFTFEVGGDIVAELNKKGLELGKLLYDPAFRSLRDQLPEEHAKLLFDQLKGTTDSATEFHTLAASVTPATPDLPDRLDSLAEKALSVARQMISTAGMFADAFAALDKRLSAGEDN